MALVQLDVTDKAQAEKAIGDAVARFGRLDVVVNNAGIAVLGYFEALSASDFERQLAPNLYGVINVLHAALPVMRKQRAGHIINISSVAGGVGQMHAAAYSASKFAVEGLSMALADEVAKFGINVTVVSRISSAASCWIRAMPASSIPVSRITPPAPRPAKHGRPMTASRTAIR
ncbi:SDR family oxidoreductase [Inquilinus ginsengisoli]|uniref:SDR family oxidoreductase n=1 Tax=Inquilinus ginsengisoli TaxID=363840 RepID=UPI003D1FFFB0